MRNKLLWILPVVLVLAVGGWYLLTPNDPRPPVYGVEVVATTPHDPQAYTEGLFYQNGAFYESTGEEGTSGIRKVKPETGEIVTREELPSPYFGEGIVAWKDQIYELTWKDQKGFIYGLNDFSPRGTFDYSGEGWGLTHNGTAIIMSDGTPTLRFLDPETLAVKSTLTVTANGCPVANLNELEWIDGQIYANIWMTDLIARIDPRTGKVTSFLNVAALGPDHAGRDDVANGIAYDPAKKRTFVTGKRWPKMYEVRVGAKQAVPDEAAVLSGCS